MTIAVAVTSTTATTATIALSGFAADGTVDVQFAPRDDFLFCVAPIFNIANNIAAPVFSALNQRATLWVRARARRASGAVEDWSSPAALRTADAAAQSTAPAAVMITPAIVVTPEKALAAFGTGTVAGYPETNAFRDSPVGWKGISAGGANHNFDMQFAGQPIDTVAVLNTNMPEAGTVTIYACPTQAGLASGTGRVTLINAQAFRASANLPMRMGYHGFFQFASTVLPWLRIVFSGTKTADTLYVEHIICGANRSSKNHSVDKTETPMPKGSIDRTRTGIADRVRGLPMRKVEFEIAMMTEAQFETIYGDLGRLENEAVFVLPNSKTGGFLHDRLLFGDMKGSRIFNPFSPRYTRGFSIESII